MSKETFYFSHDYNARNDIKIKRLIVRHGYEGYGLYWALIEDLYQNANAMPLDYDCIAFDLRSNSKLIKSIINDFELFVFDEDTFGSLSIQRRLNMRSEKSRKARRSAMKRWEDDDANASENDANALENDANALENDANALEKDENAMRLVCERNAKTQKRNAIKERKGKESKG